MNVAALLHRAARLHPARPALGLGRRVVADYLTLSRRAASLAAGLRRRLGLSLNDRVVVCAANTPQYVEAMCGCWHGGLTVVPVNARLHPKELAYIVANSGARVCFTTSEYEASAHAVSRDAGVEVVDIRSTEYERLCSTEPIASAEREPDDVAWLFYTSGTTGRPKGVMITHRNLLTLSACYFADLDTIEPGDTILHAAPMSHGSGLYILPHLALAAANVAPESGGFDPDEIHDLVSASHGVTIFVAPTMLKRMVECRSDVNLSNLKTIVYGGGPMYVADCRRALARYGDRLAQIYGQGEAPMTITVMNKRLHADRAHPRYEERLGSVGHAFLAVEVRVADPDDRPLASGEAGEILVRGDVVMRGYWADEPASAETLRNGWLHTGDVGVLDEDGFLTLKDRSKDVIICGGANVYPREVEEVLLQHAFVAEAAVVGQPDPEWGETVVAFVVAMPCARVAEAELDALCLANIARFKRPKRYMFVDALPTNMTGKVLKKALRDRL